MNLLVWRHAEAVDGVPDMARELTAHGRLQAKKVGHWIKSQLARDATVLASPAMRTRQTADALGLEYTVSAVLAPGADPAAIVATFSLAQPAAREETLVLVGHQPWIGELAALLVSGTARSWSVHKGAVWWLVHRTRPERSGASSSWSIKAVIDERML